MTVDTGTLTPNQAARRTRVLDAALSLAAEGGYDAVQMRDVASRAQVALGTIYRYFASKDHLLAACQLETWRAIGQRLETRPLTDGTAADRLVELIRRLMRQVEREPQQAAALITAQLLTRPGRAGVPGGDDRASRRHLHGRHGRPRPRGQGRRRRGCCATCGSPTLLGWVNGWNDAKAITRECEIAIHLLLDDLP